MKFRFKLIFFLLGVLSYVHAQTPCVYSFINFSEQNDLSDKYIYSITQDKQHIIWIGTSSGLYKCIGTKFVKVNSNLDKPGYQINNVLQNVYCDNSGNLWLSSINALQVYNPILKKFYGVEYQNKEVKKMIQSFIMNFYDDKKGNMWICTQKNAWYKYEIKSKKLTHFLPKGKYINQKSKNVLKIIEANNKLWAITTNGLFEFDVDGNIFQHFNTKLNFAIKNDFYDGFFDKKRNCIWLAGGSNGIVQFDLNSKKFVYNPLIEKESKNSTLANFVTLIIPKNDDTIWFSASVLGEYDIVTKKHKIYSTEYKDDFSYKNTNISRFFKDREQNLWIASYTGLSILPWQNYQIKTIPLFNQFAQYIIEPYETLDYKNGYLVANNTSNGLIWIDKNFNTKIIENPNCKNQFRTMNGIEAIVRTNRNEIYCASSSEIFLLNTEKDILIPIKTKDQNNNKLKNISNILDDKKGNLYLTSRNDGFYIYNTQLKKLQHYNLKQFQKNIDVENNMISPRYVDKDGTVWFTYTSGVYCYNVTTEKMLHIATEKAINNNAQISQSIDIVQDDEQNYWITTLDNGIFELRKVNNKYQLYNYSKTNNYLPSDYCTNINKDKNGFLWIGTSTGLIKFNPKLNKVITTLGKQHGLKENGTTIPINLLNNEELVLNYYGQLSVLNLSTYQVNKLKPEVLFTDIKILDKSLNTNEIKNKTLELNHNENFLVFNYHSNVYNNANQNKFAYLLEGYNSNWIETTESSVSFSSLPSGDYKFKIKTANNDGLWGNVQVIKFNIKAPFWKTLWFYSLIAILISGIVFAVYKLKINRIKKEEKLKLEFTKQIAEIEMKALRAQMNPHFIFNSLNSIQKYILKNDSYAASQYLTKFSKLIRLILDNSNQNFILLQSEIDLLKLYIEIESLRFDNQFEYELMVDDTLNTDTTEIPSLIIQPYIENAIWHGLLHKETKGKLTLNIIRFDENNIKVLVIDDGIGRQKAQELKSKQVLKKKSYGLQITEDRISILNKTQSNKTTLKIIDLKDENNIPLGTKVELIIPFQNIFNKK